MPRMPSAWTELKATQHLQASGRTGQTRNDVKQPQNVVLEESQVLVLWSNKPKSERQKKAFSPVPELDWYAAAALE